MNSSFFSVQKDHKQNIKPDVKNPGTFQFWKTEKKKPKPQKNSHQDIYKRWNTAINSVCFNKWRLYSDLYFSCLGFSIFNHYARFGWICCWHSTPQGAISREVNSLESQQIFSLCYLKWQERAQLCLTVIILIC